MPSVVLEHPALGKVTGRHGDGVEQYLGIQYATLKDRLAEPMLRTDYSGSIDASEHGPSSFSAPGGFEMEVGTLIQNAISTPDLRRSDVDCLNLSITVPVGARKAGKAGLPVFVWIHGGGNAVGSHSWPHYDHARLVRLAAEHGVPMIGVGINYRLGIQAAITSNELKAAGYKGNNFLRDQRTAFQWVKKHIDGFGGDADNVTVVGESAGAMSITMHLCSKQPLFERAFVTGGTCLIQPALPSGVHEMTYQKAIAALGLDKLSAEDRIKSLLTIPIDEINSKLPPSVQPRAIIDRDIIDAGLTYKELAVPNTDDVPSKLWLKALTIGDSQFDASIFYWLAGHLKPLSSKFAVSCRATLASYPEQTERLLSLYNLQSPSANDETTFLKILALFTDSLFYLGTLAFANAFSVSGQTNTNVFFFNEPNPWPGQFQGQSTHVLDVVFLFQNYNEKLPPAQKEAAKQMGLDFARFVRGEKPWSTFDGSQRNARVYGPSSVQSEDAEAVTLVVKDAISAGSGRKHEIVAIADAVGWDTLGAVFVDFLLGKHFSESE